MIDLGLGYGLTVFERETNGPEVVTLVINQQPFVSITGSAVWVGEHGIELIAREMFLFERLAWQPNDIVSLVNQRNV